jgi:hypothetical protein
MKTYPLTELIKFRPNQKFLYNEKIYTIYTHEGNMVEVFDGGKFWAWPNWAKVIPVTFDN